MDKVAGSGNDEFYTPEYAITPILKYISKDKIVWCPFDTEDSNFVKMLEKNGNKVIATHLDSGRDFFEFEPPKYDIILSNPPYSLKAQVFERLFSLKKPFAMLVGVVGLFESQVRFKMFKNNNFEIMYMDKWIAYFKDFAEQKPSLNPPFSSVYLCLNILPEQIVFEEVFKPKYKKPKLNSQEEIKTCSTKHDIPPKPKDSDILSNFT